MVTNKRRVSMEDIARRTELSRATVSYVLNGRRLDAITEATRQKVLKAASEMGYKPNRFALALKNEKTHQIEILTPDIYPGFYSRVLKEFFRQLDTTDYEPRIVSARHWSEADWSGDAGLWPADGIIAFDAELSDLNLTALLSRKTPLVCCGTNCRTEVDHVSIDLETPARLAVRHLIAHKPPNVKRQRIAYLSRGSTLAEAKSETRGIAYIDEMKTVRLKPEFLRAMPQAGETDRGAARRTVREFVARHGAPDAFFAYTDEFAIGAMAALRELNLSVPGDVRVIGCDGLEDGEYQVPPLATIAYPYAELARLTWQFLLRRIVEPQSPRQSAELVAQFELRESAGFIQQIG